MPNASGTTSRVKRRGRNLPHGRLVDREADCRARNEEQECQPPAGQPHDRFDETGAVAALQVPVRGRVEHADVIKDQDAEREDPQPVEVVSPLWLIRRKSAAGDAWDRPRRSDLMSASTVVIAGPDLAATSRLASQTNAEERLVNFRSGLPAAGPLRPVCAARFGALQARPLTGKAAAAAGEAVETTRQALSAGQERKCAVRADRLEDAAVDLGRVADASAGRRDHHVAAAPQVPRSDWRRKIALRPPAEPRR